MSTTTYRNVIAAALATALLTACVMAVTPVRAGKQAATGAKTGQTTQTAGQTVRSGTFEGRSDHVTSGGVRIERRADGKTYVVLGQDFSLDGAPDPKIAFGKDGYVKGTIFAKLENLKGEQVYAVPTGLNVSEFNQVWIWCEKFDVPLGVADIA